ncbi:TerD family protein [Kitasatospora sp. Ki12]
MGSTRPGAPKRPLPGPPFRTRGGVRAHRPDPRRQRTADRRASDRRGHRAQGAGRLRPAADRCRKGALGRRLRLLQRPERPRRQPPPGRRRLPRRDHRRHPGRPRGHHQDRGHRQPRRPGLHLRRDGAHRHRPRRRHRRGPGHLHPAPAGPGDRAHRGRGLPAQRRLEGPRGRPGLRRRARGHRHRLRCQRRRLPGAGRRGHPGRARRPARAPAPVAAPAPAPADRTLQLPTPPADPFDTPPPPPAAPVDPRIALATGSHPLPPVPPAPPAAPPAPAAPARITLDKGRVSLVKGSSVSLVKNGRPFLSSVRMALGWEPAARGRSVDLDASCLAFDARHKRLETAWFMKLNIFNGAIAHSGDNLTGGGDGDDELITVHLEGLPAEVHGLVFVVNSFSGQKFTDVKNAYCRLLDAATNEELVRFDLTHSEARTGVVMCKLVRRPGGEWEMTALGEYVDGKTARAMIEPAAALL